MDGPSVLILLLWRTILSLPLSRSSLTVTAPHTMGDSFRGSDHEFGACTHVYTYTFLHMYIYTVYTHTLPTFSILFLASGIGRKTLSVGSRLRLGLIPGLLCFTQRLSSCVCLRTLVAHTGTHG